MVSSSLYDTGLLVVAIFSLPSSAAERAALTVINAIKNIDIFKVLCISNPFESISAVHKKLMLMNQIN